MPVDSFKFLPRLIETFYRSVEIDPPGEIPWTPLAKPLRECTFGLVTSGGLHPRGAEPFDLEREQAEPTWGDPTYRAIPVDLPQEQLRVSHLHYNPRSVELDRNVLLPVDRFRELAAAGEIGGLAPQAYSFMGYQGFPPDTTAWRETYGPQVAGFLKDQGVDCVLLTPS